MQAPANPAVMSGWRELAIWRSPTLVLEKVMFFSLFLIPVATALRLTRQWRQENGAAQVLLLAVAGCVPAAPGAFRFGLLFACYAAVGICGSLYIVPVSSQIQLLPAAEEKGRILGTSNFFSFSITAHLPYSSCKRG